MKGILTNSKKRIGLFSAAVVTLIVVICIALSNNVFAATSEVYFYVRQNQGALLKVMDFMNRDRSSGDGFWVDGNGVQHKVGKLNGIPWDSDLETVAKSRANEIVVNYSHVRPNGSSFTTLSYNKKNSQQEYIYKISSSSSLTDDALANNIYNYLFNVGRGQAAVSMMATNFQSFAAACTVYEGNYYIVLEFSTNPANGRKLPGPSTNLEKVCVTYDTSTVKEKYVVQNPTASETHIIGSTSICFIGNVDVYLGSVKTKTISDSVNNQNFVSTWKADNTSIVKADNRSFRFIKGGTVKITGTGTLNGKVIATKVITVNVQASSIKSVRVEFPTPIIYTGSQIKVKPTVTLNNEVLKEGVDYTITGYTNNVNVNENSNMAPSTITIKGDGVTIEGSDSFEFRISPADISGISVTSGLTSEFNNVYQKINPVVTLNGKKLIKETDFTIECKYGCFDIGTYPFAIVGKGNYTGKVQKVFTITQTDISKAQVLNADDSFVYSGYANTFESLRLKLNSEILGINEYTATYSNNINAGTATLTITGKNNCKGTIVKTFKIEPAEFNFPFEISSKSYTGKPLTPEVKFNSHSKPVLNKDYKVTYSNNLNVGTAKYTVTAIGNYKGSIEKTFEITPAWIDYCIVSGVSDVLYDGKPVVFDNIVVSDRSNNVFVKDKDYTITYNNNVDIGIASVTIKGIGNCHGTNVVYFYITRFDLPPFSPNTSGTGVEGFVERLYTVALGRASEPDGKAYWVEKLMTKQMTGGAVAKKMLLSSEFFSKKYTNEEFVEILYRTFFNRSGEPTGTKYWLDKLRSGISRQSVINSFIDSNEWAGICSSYGISSGNSKNPPEVAPTDKTVAFVKRLYTCCLGRNGEIKGIADWSIALANKKYTGKEVAQKFFFSTEFKNKKLDNTEFVKRLYRTLMGREAGSSEITYWTNLLTSGKTREQIFDMFANSKEWATICSNAGIASGAKAQALTLDIDLLEEETENQIPESDDDIVTEITETEADEATDEVISEDVSETADEEIADTTDEEETEVSDIPSEVETVEEVSTDETVAEESDASDYTETAVSENIEETDCLEVA